MNAIRLHEDGPKGARDREHCVHKYDELCRFFHVRRIKDSDLAKLRNQQIYKLTEDLYNRQPPRKKIRYAKYLGIGRENDTSFRRWWNECISLYKPNFLGRAVLLAKSPWLYPDFVSRKKASIAKKKADAEAAKKTMVDAAKGPLPFSKPEETPKA
jgi:hypothetical protein